MKILVSKCLLGYPCRYDGKSCPNQKVIDLQNFNEVFAVCPEQCGGLPTPRDPGERVKDKVISKTGKDITAEYTKGAEYALKLALDNNVDYAILKAKSPSCGKGLIYDGTFTGGKVKGNGLTTDLLLKNGIKVISDEEL